MNNIKQSIRQKPLTAISIHFTPGINETKGITVVIFIIKATHNAMIPNPYIMRYGLKNSFIVGASIPEHFFTVYLTYFSKPATRRLTRPPRTAVVIAAAMGMSQKLVTFWTSPSA